MKLAILSRAPQSYSTGRLKAAALAVIGKEEDGESGPEERDLI